MTPPATAKRAAIVYNPIKVDVGKLRNAVAAAESAAGWRKSLWLETSEDDPGKGQAARAIKEKVDVVLAAGGDGTVRCVADGLRGSDVSLALLAAGTGNILARNMDLNASNLDAAVEIAFTGKDRKIDIGVVEIERIDGTREELTFVVMAGIGLDAKMIANTDPELKKRVGWLAYVDAIRRSIRDSQKLRVRYTIDDGARKAMTAHTVLVGNCGSLPGNVLLLPDAAIDDGVFDIIALRPESFFGWVQVWVKVFWENGVLRRSSVGRKIVAGLGREVRTLRYLKAATFTARLDREEEFELDGDEYGKAIAFRARVDPGALAVRVPADREIDESKNANAQDAGVNQDAAVA